MLNRSRENSEMGMTLGNMHDSQEELKIGLENVTISSENSSSEDDIKLKPNPNEDNIKFEDNQTPSNLHVEDI
jgi:hypothetical protein